MFAATCVLAVSAGCVVEEKSEKNCFFCLKQREARSKEIAGARGRDFNAQSVGAHKAVVERLVIVQFGWQRKFLQVLP
jgi:hypothetical protein